MSNDQCLKLRQDDGLTMAPLRIQHGQKLRSVNKPKAFTVNRPIDGGFTVNASIEEKSREKKRRAITAVRVLPLILLLSLLILPPPILLSLLPILILGIMRRTRSIHAAHEEHSSGAPRSFVRRITVIRAAHQEIRFYVRFVLLAE